MPLPFLLVGAAAIAGAIGIGKGAKAVSNNSKAKNLIEEARELYDSAKYKLDIQKEDTTTQLNSLAELKLLSWSEDIGAFVKLFSEFKNVKLESKVEVDKLLQSKINEVGSLKKMEIAALKASDVMKIGTSSLGAGALAGIASYGGAMMFASASTGTAIASLSGVAATNATMAWFGGGSLAAGGLGMAGGAAVLGGIVVAPVLAIAGVLMAAKSEENLSKANKTYSEAKNAAEKMNTLRSFLEQVENLANSYEEFIGKYRYRYESMLEQLYQISLNASEKQGKKLVNKIKSIFKIKYKINFELLENEEKQFLHVVWLATQVLNVVLSAPLLTKGGDIDNNAFSILESAEESSVKLLNA